MKRAVALALLVTACVAPRPDPVPASIARAPAPVAAAPRAIEPFRYTGTPSQGGLIVGTAPRGTVRLALGGRTIEVTAAGGFVVGFDRDAGPSATLVATLADGRVVTERILVAPRAWAIERLDSLPRIAQPDAEFARRRPAELARIVAARAIDGGAAGWRQRFRWPVTGRISGLFGAQRVYRGEPGAFHSGVDVARGEGTPVVAPADGVVVLAAADPFTIEGRLLIVDHGMGVNSAFLHLSRIDVVEGARVAQGQPLGAVGRTGRATGPHLHWSIKWRDARIDPLLVTGPMPAG